MPAKLDNSLLTSVDHVIDLDDNDSEYARPPQDDEDDAPNCLG
jgi:hypothetical protein